MSPRVIIMSLNIVGECHQCRDQREHPPASYPIASRGRYTRACTLEGRRIKGHARSCNRGTVAALEQRRHTQGRSHTWVYGSRSTRAQLARPMPAIDPRQSRMPKCYTTARQSRPMPPPIDHVTVVISPLNKTKRHGLRPTQSIREFFSVVHCIKNGDQNYERTHFRRARRFRFGQTRRSADAERR